ncbi:hypothetical protein HZS_1115, partial [Henneguya salminicola]
ILKLLGKIDITAKVIDIKPINGAEPCLREGDIVPIEIKTGKIYFNGNLEHRAQSMLYSLAIENRYGVETNKSILLYIKGEGQAVLVKATQYEIFAFIEARNRLVSSLHDHVKSLPDFAITSEPCRFCPVLDACNLHALEENKSHPFPNIAINKLRCNAKDIEFFKTWNYETLVEVDRSLKNRTTDVFQDETANRMVHEIDSRLGMMKIKMENPLSTDYLGYEFDFRLMITNSISFLPISFLTHLFTDKTDHSVSLRNIIIDYKSPIFSDNNILEMDSNLLQTITKFFGSTMDTPHISAIEHCIRAQDYALLWGLPGTGKTTTVAALLYLLHALNKTVLVTSHTNAAVDNILLKLLEFNVPFLRIGKINSVHSDLKQHTLDYILGTTKEWNLEDFKDLIQKH